MGPTLHPLLTDQAANCQPANQPSPANQPPRLPDRLEPPSLSRVASPEGSWARSASKQHAFTTCSTGSTAVPQRSSTGSTCPAPALGPSCVHAPACSSPPKHGFFQPTILYQAASKGWPNRMLSLTLPGHSQGTCIQGRVHDGEQESKLLRLLSRAELLVGWLKKDDQGTQRT